MSLELYYRDVSHLKLLNAAQEIELANKVKAGDDKAREEFITANLRLVVHIAEDFKNFGVPLLDLIAEGNTGLMRAVDLFDPNHGNRFSAYARHWIRHKIFRALANQSRIVRYPAYVVERIRSMETAEINALFDCHSDVNNAFLAEKLELTEAQIRELKGYRNRQEVSLEGWSGADPVYGGDSLKDSISPYEVADNDFDIPLDPSEVLDRKLDLARVQAAFTVLTERECFIMQRRFPLDGTLPMKLEDLAKLPEVNLTRERVRQIQNEALEKLQRAIQVQDA